MARTAVGLFYVQETNDSEFKGGRRRIGKSSLPASKHCDALIHLILGARLVDPIGPPVRRLLLLASTAALPLPRQTTSHRVPASLYRRKCQISNQRRLYSGPQIDRVDLS